MAQAASAPVLSIVVPVYNEARTVAAVIDRLMTVPFPVAREVLVVDDGSTDGTGDILKQFDGRRDISVLVAARNQGKGAAIRRGIDRAKGRILAIQDADLELDPGQLPALVQPVVDGRAQAVYGSRFLGGRPEMPFVSRCANRALTAITNVVCGGHVTDMETCYKIVPTDVLRSLRLESDRFDIEAEITAKLLLRRCTITELPIVVHSRSKAAGKKIGWRDGVNAVRAILRYGVKERRAIKSFD